MKKNLTFNFVLALLVSSTTLACKMNQETKDVNKEVTGIGGIVASAPRNYTNSELEIGRRICGNLKKKREFFETLSNEKEQFRFRGELRNCDNGTYNNSLFVAAISNANSTDLEYIANRDKYFKDVTTDQSGVMKTVCDSLIQSDVVSNNILTGTFKYSVNFLIAEGFDSYQVIKAKKNAAGTYDTLSSEGVSLISNKNQAPAKFLGVEKDRVRYTVCDGDRYQTVRQIWIEAITNF